MFLNPESSDRVLSCCFPWFTCFMGTLLRKITFLDVFKFFDYIISDFLKMLWNKVWNPRRQATKIYSLGAFFNRGILPSGKKIGWSTKNEFSVASYKTIHIFKGLLKLKNRKIYIKQQENHDKGVKLWLTLKHQYNYREPIRLGI